jgi:glycosyltransferase involved in cell wall biosynthesis
VFSKPVILHILHLWGGGTEKHVNALTKKLTQTATSLIATPATMSTVRIRSADSGYCLDIEVDNTSLATTLKKLNVSLVHIHQLIGYTVDIEDVITKLEVPFYTTIHDYTLVCPQINFVTSDGQYCNESTVDTTCNSCINNSTKINTNRMNISQWRNKFNWAITKADKVICPSNDVLCRISKFISDANYIIVPHEDINSSSKIVIPKLSNDQPMRIALLGTLTINKGAKIINELVDLVRKSDRPLQFILIGTSPEIQIGSDDIFIEYGKYHDYELQDIIAKTDPHVIMIFPIWPETYSYTLSAAINSSRPIIVNTLGALAERVINRAWTWILPDNLTSLQLVDKLVEIRNSNFELQTAPKLGYSPQQTQLYKQDFYQSGYLNITKEPQMKKNIVLITSAIHTNYGIYSTTERIQQTLRTIKSVHNYMPNPVIILIDNSKISIQNDTSAELEELVDSVAYYIDNSDDPDIQHFHNNVQNYDIGKNVMESLGLLKTLQYISTDAELMGEVLAASRIFKISGRYELTEKFDIDAFDNEQTIDRYVFKKAVPSWISEEDTRVDHQLYTRLWSFSPSLFSTTIDLYQQIIQNMFTLINQGKYIDIEHSMAKFIPKDKLIELDTLGLIGNIAPNGVGIND